MEEQQKRTEKLLFDLKRDFPNCVSISLHSKRDFDQLRRSDYPQQTETEKGTRAFLSSEKRVQVVLIEPTTKEELDQWSDALVKAEELVDQVNKVIAHENNHPDWFKSIEAKFQNDNLLRNRS